MDAFCPLCDGDRAASATRVLALPEILRDRGGGQALAQQARCPATLVVLLWVPRGLWGQHDLSGDGAGFRQPQGVGDAGEGQSGGDPDGDVTALEGGEDLGEVGA